MPTLSQYTIQVQRLLHDPTGTLYPVSDIQAYINETRSRLALQAECVRVLYAYNDAAKFTVAATTAGTRTVTVVSTVGIAVGQLATGLTGIILGTYVTAIPPQTSAGTITVSIAIAAGSGTLTLTPPYQTVVGQEVYPYPSNVLLSAGIQNVIQVKSVAVNWGGVNGSSKPMLEQWSFTKYQAFLGYYGPNLQGNPAVWTSYQNSVAMRPVPSSVWPIQLDAICSVVDLVDDTSVEALPFPYTDSVKYYAAYLAYMNSQNPEPSKAMLTLYNQTMNEARSFTQRTFVPYVYR